MAIKLDFSKANDGNIKDGTYEAVISGAREDVNPNSGNEFMNVNLVIRNDVQQAYQNAHIFFKTYRSNATHDYNEGIVNTIAKAANLQDGKVYKDYEELFQDLQGHPVKVQVKNETRTYNGKEYHDLNVKKWLKSDYPNIQHQWKHSTKSTVANNDPFAKQATDQNFKVEDTDLPF